MAFAVQDTFLVGYTRQVFQVYAADTVATQWRAMQAGAPGAPFLIRDADEGLGVFVTAAGVNPNGFSPYGDLVDVTYMNLDLVTGTGLALAPLATTYARGVVFTWISLPSFPGFLGALVYTKSVEGVSDNLIVALPEEMAIVKRNPHFFPNG